MAIDVYGATWCGDCKQAKNTLEELGAEYTWHNIETEDGAADRAVPSAASSTFPWCSILMAHSRSNRRLWISRTSSTS